MGSARWIKRSNNRRSPRDDGRGERVARSRGSVCVQKRNKKGEQQGRAGLRSATNPLYIRVKCMCVCVCVRVCLCRHVSRDVKEAKKKRKTGRANDVLHHISGTFTKFVELFGILMFFFLLANTHFLHINPSGWSYHPQPSLPSPPRSSHFTLCRVCEASSI